LGSKYQSKIEQLQLHFPNEIAPKKPLYFTQSEMIGKENLFWHKVAQTWVVQKKP
jgi:hypothetical protein